MKFIQLKLIAPSLAPANKMRRKLNFSSPAALAQSLGEERLFQKSSLPLNGFDPDEAHRAIASTFQQTQERHLPSTEESFQFSPLHNSPKHTLSHPLVVPPTPVRFADTLRPIYTRLLETYTRQLTKKYEFPIVLTKFSHGSYHDVYAVYRGMEETPFMVIKILAIECKGGFSEKTQEKIYTQSRNEYDHMQRRHFPVAPIPHPDLPFWNLPYYPLDLDTTDRITAARLLFETVNEMLSQGDFEIPDLSPSNIKKTSTAGVSGMRDLVVIDFREKKHTHHGGQLNMSKYAMELQAMIREWQLPESVTTEIKSRLKSTIIQLSQEADGPTTKNATEFLEQWTLSAG